MTNAAVVGPDVKFAVESKGNAASEDRFWPAAAVLFYVLSLGIFLGGCLVKVLVLLGAIPRSPLEKLGLAAAFVSVVVFAFIGAHAQDRHDTLRKNKGTQDPAPLNQSAR